MHSEVDYDSTLVAGSNQLGSALLAEPGIECLEVGPATLLTMHADQVNSRELPASADERTTEVMVLWRTPGGSGPEVRYE